MIRKLLAIAALIAALSFAAPTTKAAPAGILEALKASAVEVSTIQHVRHYRRYHRHYGYRNCWWQDRWLCRYFW